jgi:hypothetical protein
VRDAPTDGVTGETTRPGVEDGSQIDEAHRDRDVGDVRNPQIRQSASRVLSAEFRGHSPAPMQTIGFTANFIANRSDQFREAKSLARHEKASWAAGVAKANRTTI